MVDGAAKRRGKGQLVIFVRLKDGEDRSYQDHGTIDLEKIEDGIRNQNVLAKEPGLTSAHVALAQTYYKLRKKDDGDRERAIVARLQAEERARQAEVRNGAPRL